MVTPPIIQGSDVRPQGMRLMTAVPVFVTVFLIVMIISTAITFILPESYASTARVKVDYAGMFDDKNGNYLKTEFEIIQSQTVLNKVIEKLNLNVVWGRKYFNGETLRTSEALAILKARLILADVRGTKLIAITVYSDDRNEAAQIANAVAESYHDFSIERRKKALASANPLILADPPVLIIDQAQPALQPCRPNKPLNIALGAVAGIILGSVAAALVVFFKTRSQPKQEIR
jgi:uncharacterized protein involved in exopolysaccharide biosynthesis